MSIKVLVIGEVPALRNHARQVACRALSDDPNVFAYEAEGSAESMRLFDSHRPELVIMDTAGINGLKLAQYIWCLAPHTRILFWVSKHRQFQHNELKRLVPPGALAGYITQTADDEVMCRAITALMVKSTTYMDPDLANATISFDPTHSLLTVAEQETLGDLLLGLTDKAIAKKRSLTVRGVQNRLSSLATKLLGRERSQMESGMEFYNLRVRMIFEALKLGIFTLEDIPELERGLSSWMESSFKEPSTQQIANFGWSQ